MNFNDVINLPYVEQVKCIQENTLDDLTMRQLAQTDRNLMPIVAENLNISEETANIIYNTQCYKSLVSFSKNPNKQNILSSDQLEDLDTFIKNKSFKQHFTCTTCDERENINCLVGNANKKYEENH